MPERRAVVTLCSGSLYSKMAAISHPTLRDYAEKCGAEFVVLGDDEARKHSTPHWAKLALGELLNRYDRIVYLDTDIIVRDDAPNLFELVPFDSIGAFDESPFNAGRGGSIDGTCREYQLNVEWDGVYFNTGVMVLSPLHKRLFTPPPFENSSFYEQGYLNVMRLVHGIKFFPLEHTLNRMSCMDRVTGEARHDSFILHYAGHPDFSVVPDLMKKDLMTWLQSAPEYKFKRRIWVDVQGGLGDQVAAEPAVRYMIEQAYPGDDIIVTTHWPRIFQHLNVPVSLHGPQNPWDSEPWHVVTLPGPETIQWKVCSHMMCHCVDYTAMALLRRTLQHDLKSIRLQVGVEDIQEVIDVIGIRPLTDLTLVHCGKHWESKTFPVEWWQSVIDGLQAAGHTVCLIGKEDDNRGTVDVTVREGMIDTRNRLSLGGLFALIGGAWCLVSNDSAPVHIAGASDGYIVMVPTCKHEDHVFPYRNGTTQYKTKAVYKDLFLDDCDNRPTVLRDTSVEFIKRDWNCYLPEPEEIIQAVTEAKQNDTGFSEPVRGTLPASELEATCGVS